VGVAVLPASRRPHRPRVVDRQRTAAHDLGAHLVGVDHHQIRVAYRPVVGYGREEPHRLLRPQRTTQTAGGDRFGAGVFRVRQSDGEDLAALPEVVAPGLPVYAGVVD